MNPVVVVVVVVVRRSVVCWLTVIAQGSWPIRPTRSDSSTPPPLLFPRSTTRRSRPSFFRTFAPLRRFPSFHFCGGYKEQKKKKKRNSTTVIILQATLQIAQALLYRPRCRMRYGFGRNKKHIRQRCDCKYTIAAVVRAIVFHHAPDCQVGPEIKQ